MPADPEKRLEDWTHDQIKDYLRGNLSSRIGLNLVSNEEPWISFLGQELKEGDLLPIQISSGPLLSLRYTSRLPESIINLVHSKKIELIVHLPFVLSMYKDFDSLGYQRMYFRELFDYYNSLGIDYKMVLHCGHPAAGTSEQQQEENFIRNVESSVSSMVRGKLLLENLASPDWTAWVTPQALYSRYFETKKLDTTKLGICLDTEHLFASGYRVSSIESELYSTVDAVHLNSAPRIVQLGSGVDLHSYTEIEASLQGQGGVFYNPESPDSLVEFKQFLYLIKDKPKVLERHLMSIQAKDIEFCNRIMKEQL